MKIVNKCVFLDRDGVLNNDRVDYVYKVDDLIVKNGVSEALKKLKAEGYLLIVITNQSGIDKGIFTESDVNKVHDEIQSRTGRCIDEFYISIFHRTITKSLATKPGSLLFEKAIAKYNIDIVNSWMVGDRLRDLEPANKLGIKGILVDNEYNENYPEREAKNLLDAVDRYILN